MQEDDIVNTRKDGPPLPKTQLHGVVHRISQNDYRQIRRTEAGGGHSGIGYDEVLVQCQAYNGKTLKALALIYPPLLAQREAKLKLFQPSLRYMKLLMSGAKHSGLDSQYQAFLEKTEYYNHRSNSGIWFVGRIFRVLFIAYVMLLLSPFLTTAFLCHRFRIEPPFLLHWYFEKVKTMLWLIHGMGYKYLAGSGGEADKEVLMAKKSE